MRRHRVDPYIAAFIVAVAMAAGVVAGVRLAHLLMAIGAVLHGV